MSDSSVMAQAVVSYGFARSPPTNGNVIFERQDSAAMVSNLSHNINKICTIFSQNNKSTIIVGLKKNNLQWI